YFSQSTTGHGRVESREIRVASAEGIDFPHAAQVFQIIRRSKKLRSRSWERKEVVFGVTALSADQAGPADLAGYAKDHWSVENKSHYVRSHLQRGCEPDPDRARACESRLAAKYRHRRVPPGWPYQHRPRPKPACQQLRTRHLTLWPLDIRKPDIQRTLRGRAG